MLTRRTHGTLLMALAVALIASTVACGSAREPASINTTDCSTCHGYPPAKDLHAIHFNTDMGATGGVPHAQIACLSCHENVTSVNQPGHIVDANGKPLPAPAQVRFDDPASLASVTQPGATRAAAAGYDATARTCSNVYCHGAGLKGATEAVVLTPGWGASNSVGCGNCHGIPPADHPSGLTALDCHKCHGDAIDAQGNLNFATHVDGKVELASNVTSSCAACHGDADARAAGVNVPPGDPRSAPPTDAEGNAASPAVGAHQRHLTGGALNAGIACSECHVVPTTVLAPGHLDNEVTVTFGALAKTGGAKPTYDKTTQTCSNVYCHGNFPLSKATPVPNPTWNEGLPAVGCGACHDLPPPAPAHLTIDVPTQGCGTPSTSQANLGISCHPAPYSPSSVDPKLHIDGKVCPPSCTPTSP